MAATCYIKSTSNTRREDLLKKPRYAELCSPTNWIEIKQEFQRDFCSLLKMSAESPLYTR